MKTCAATNDIPHTNMRTGRMFWISEPCKEPPKEGSRYCWWHQDRAHLEKGLQKLVPQIEREIAKAKRKNERKSKSS